MNNLKLTFFFQKAKANTLNILLNKILIKLTISKNLYFESYCYDFN